METRGAMNFEPRITRMGTDEDRGTQGCAFKSLHKQACTGL